MKTGKPALRCKIVFRSEQDGGRATPLADGALKSGLYRPHFVLGETSQMEPVVGPGNQLTEDYVSVQFEDGPDKFAVGEEIEVRVRLIFYGLGPQSIYDGFIPGANFTIREPPRIVGHGTVLEKLER